MASKSLPKVFKAFVAAKSLSLSAKSTDKYFDTNAVFKGDQASGIKPKVLYSIG